MEALVQRGLSLGATYKNADHAFVMLYELINSFGNKLDNGTKALFDVGFYIENPMDNYIVAPFRKWNPRYAKREWDWYVSRDRSVKELKKYAPIWDEMHGGDNIVNSNYGWQWNRNFQLRKALKQLRDNKDSRQAFVTIYDGKEKADYQYDTPCTLNIGFRLYGGRLHMKVLMRSNDLWYGFCNDQYCFSMLMQQAADLLDVKVGTYFHYATDMHLYDRHLK